MRSFLLALALCAILTSVGRADDPAPTPPAGTVLPLPENTALQMRTVVLEREIFAQRLQIMESQARDIRAEADKRSQQYKDMEAAAIKAAGIDDPSQATLDVDNRTITRKAAP